MEPLTHMLTGACLSRAGLNRKTGLATLTLVLVLEAPDVDFVSYAGGSVSLLEHHRGITHSLVGAPFVAGLTLAVVYGVYRLMRRRGWEPKLPPNWKVLYVYAVFGALVHLLQDSTNNYGVRPFAPFNPKWYSWDIVPLIDPLMLAALFLGLVVPGLLSLVTEEIGDRRAKFRGRGGAVFALTCIVAVILLRDYQHSRAVNALTARTYHDENPAHVSAYPQMGPFSWKGLVETNDFFELLPVDTLSEEVDPQNIAIVRYKPEETPVTLAAKKSRLGRVFLDWAQYPITEVERLPGEGGYQVQLSDLRFARAVGAASRQGLPSLAGYVVLDPQLRVEEMNVGAPPIAVGKAR